MTQLQTLSLEDQLGFLAMRFRGNKDEAARDAAVAEYAHTVRKLIESGTWKEMPTFEDMLPSDRMPESFYIFWSLHSPREHPVSEQMKPVIFVEGRDDAEILTAILPRRVLAVCKLRPTDGRSTLVEAAKTHVAKHDAPVGIVFDTNTPKKKDSEREAKELKKELTAAVGHTSHAVFACIPEIEAILFANGVDLSRLFPSFKAVYQRRVATTSPKKQLEALLLKGGGPNTLEGLLAKLTRDEIEHLRYVAPIPCIIAFVITHLPF